ncbi:hypothetical protein [Dyella sp. S184]|uniref:tetratricopeptide repeat protein n=1 Tax=Dyella sp. S184 TaxID=1641862 RepID=UPI00131C7C0B|nr:hypothetical protein [Dyella sp. S184]
MGILDKFLGRKQDASNDQPKVEVSAVTSKAASSENINVPATITIADAYGRSFQVTREQWRTEILPKNFELNRDKPDVLVSMITDALRNGFCEEALEPARRLHQIDQNGQRGAVILGVTLLQLKRYTEARDVLEAARELHGEEGSLLTNLAKAYGGLGEQERADATLWHAIEIDPNQDNGLLWYVALQGERGGEQAKHDAFVRASKLPHAWRPQIWLARDALKAKGLDAALAYYHQAAERVTPMPTDALRQISGDLGIHGHLQAMLTLVSPLFDAKLHGLDVGNNLIKANIDLGHTKEARAILGQLHRQQRVDWEQHLAFWDGEIDKAEKHYGPVSDAPTFTFGMLKLEDPIWVREALGFAALLAPKPDNAPYLAFMAGSCAKAISTEQQQITLEKTDALGRFSRGLPMYLAEQTLLRSDTKVAYLQPWSPKGGFILAGGPWEAAQLSTVIEGNDYVVFTHIDATQSPWQVKFELVQTVDGRVLSTWTCEADEQNPSAQQIAQMETTLLKQLASVPGVVSTEIPPGLESPDVAWLAHFTVAMEQSLAVSCSLLDDVPENFLYAERSIFNNLLHLSLQMPANARMRLLLLSAIDRESTRKPDVAAEYGERLARLQREFPLGGAVGDVIAVASKRIAEKCQG